VRDESPQGGYKLLLVPLDKIADPRPDDDPATAWVLDGIRNLTSNGPFHVIADVGPDRQLRMSRPLYEQIEVVEPR
jgi:hypothetical protein